MPFVGMAAYPPVPPEKPDLIICVSEARGWNVEEILDIETVWTMPSFYSKGSPLFTTSPKKQQIRQKAIRIVESSESQIRVRYIRTQKIEGR